MTKRTNKKLTVVTTVTNGKDQVQKLSNGHVRVLDSRFDLYFGNSGSLEAALHWWRNDGHILELLKKTF